MKNKTKYIAAISAASMLTISAFAREAAQGSFGFRRGGEFLLFLISVVGKAPAEGSQPLRAPEFLKGLLCHLRFAIAEKLLK